MYGCGEQEVGVASGIEWVESMGVATGCGFKEIYRFPHTTYPYSSCICTFLQQHPYFFVHFWNIRPCTVGSQLSEHVGTRGVWITEMYG